MSRGDIVLVPFPFTDLTSKKVRPAVVISSDSINKGSGDIIVAFISSVIPEQIEDTDFLLRSEQLYFKTTGLKKIHCLRWVKL